MEDALFEIAPTIDVVAKKRYPEMKRVGERVKAFIFDEQALIYFLSTQGKIKLPDGVRIVMVVSGNEKKPWGNTPDHRGELADFIYHNIRCAQSHEAEIDYRYIDLGRQFGICRQTFENDGEPPRPGVFVISNATVLSLILAVICATENKRIRLPGDIILYNKIKLDSKELPGNKTYLVNMLEGLFCGGST